VAPMPVFTTGVYCHAQNAANASNGKLRRKYQPVSMA
jgi:hypothetical protein